MILSLSWCNDSKLFTVEVTWWWPSFSNNMWQIILGYMISTDQSELSKGIGTLETWCSLNDSAKSPMLPNCSWEISFQSSRVDNFWTFRIKIPFLEFKQSALFCIRHLEPTNIFSLFFQTNKNCLFHLGILSF